MLDRGLRFNGEHVVWVVLVVVVVGLLEGSGHDFLSWQVAAMVPADEDQSDD